MAAYCFRPEPQHDPVRHRPPGVSRHHGLCRFVGPADHEDLQSFRAGSARRIPGDGGDAKLAAAIALWLGLGQILPFIIYSGLWGGTLTTTLLIIRRWPLPETFRRVTWVDRLHDNTKGVPYGLALAAAALFVYPHTDIYRALIATIG